MRQTLMITGIIGWGLLQIGATPPHVIDKYHVTSEEKEACGADVVKLCIQTYPDEDAMIGCMKANFTQLSPRCQVVFHAGLKRRHL